MRRNLDLIAALLAVAALTAGYLLLMAVLPVQPGSLVGHGIGIVGAVLVLATETLYSLRKRSWRAVGGPLQNWLSAHIFMGIVGPYMIVLHTGFRYGGIAGVTTLLMVVVVVSGFVGRFIYTAVPRNAAGVELEAAQLTAAASQAEAQLQSWLSDRPAQIQTLAAQMGGLPAAGEGLLGVLGRTLIEWDYKMRWRREAGQLDRESRRQARELGRLLARRRTLQRQIATQSAVRRLLALWHTLHVPVGMALFTAAFLHILAAIYYR